MKNAFKLSTIMIITVVLSVFFSLSVFAECEDVSKQCDIKTAGGSISKLTDGVETTYISLTEDGEISILSEKDIACIYVIFYNEPVKWIVSSGEKTSQCGENGFLHEFVDVEENFGGKVKEISLLFPNGGDISEISVFETTETPSWVQKWKPCCEKADIMLLTTHSDDEQLFFSGVLPYYAGEKGYAVQVVYMVNHNNNKTRPHELLNGLWTVGVTNYPVIGEAPDLYSESLEQAKTVFEKQGYSYEYFVEYQVENIRRFKPQVIVSHDVKGEYGHGAHMLNVAALREALEISNDSTKYTESAEKYGVWDVKKTYLHLWGENKITMNWDIPLEKFGGKTAFQVSQDGFMCHKSQHWTWFYDWIFGKNGKNDKAADIKTYSPCEYGLYRTTVGVDTTADFTENIVSYAEQDRMAEEQRKAEEEAKKAADESMAAESSRLEAESMAKAESEEVRRQNLEKNKVKYEKIKKVVFICVILSVVIVFACIYAAILKKKRGKH